MEQQHLSCQSGVLPKESWQVEADQTQCHVAFLWLGTARRFTVKGSLFHCERVALAANCALPMLPLLPRASCLNTLSCSSCSDVRTYRAHDTSNLVARAAKAARTRSKGSVCLKPKPAHQNRSLQSLTERVVIRGPKGSKEPKIESPPTPPTPPLRVRAHLAALKGLAQEDAILARCIPGWHRLINSGGKNFTGRVFYPPAS